MAETSQTTRHVPMTRRQRLAVKEVLQFAIEHELHDVRPPRLWAPFPFKDAVRSKMHVQVVTLEQLDSGSILLQVQVDFRGRSTMAWRLWTGRIGKRGGIKASNQHSKRGGQLHGFHAMLFGWHH